MDSPDRTRTKPRALATVLPQILFYVCVLCVYILVMMAWQALRLTVSPRKELT